MRYWMLLACLFASALLAQDPAWDPAKTRVFAVGILNFQDDKLATWPDEGRVDANMIAALKKRGVTEDKLVFLKNAEATRQAMEQKLSELLAASAEDETLIFYYAGHGARDLQDEQRTVSLVCYDSLGAKPKTRWNVADVVALIERGFKGKTVLLTADCCHSGAFQTVVQSLKTTKQWGVLASVQAASRSTGNWTFTQCLVDMYEGNALLDANGDGSVTFQETANWAEAEMAFCEEQLSCSGSRGFNARCSMAKAGDKKPARAGERLEAQDEGEWWKVKVLDSKDGKLLVTWLGWDKKWDRWIEEKQARAYKPKLFEGGTVVEVDWDGTWYKAKVMQNRLGLHLIHYEGYPATDDEYVPRKRIRLPAKKETK